jgi:hypothetical protein
MICMSKSCQSSITTRFYYYYKSIKIKSHPYIQRRKDFLLGFIHPIRLFDYKVRGSGLNPVYSFISASMRSVSIVYKKGQRDSCCQLIPQSSSPSPLNQPSRSVDNYYDRLFVKHEQR